jgi:hypothetical protein
MWLRLVGDNAGYLARCWQERGPVKGSLDSEPVVEIYKKPNRAGGEALYSSYFMRLAAEAKGVGVALTLEDNSELR